MKSIVVATEFSPAPAGRDDADGPFSGDALAHRVHLALASHAEVELQLDGGMGYGRSFIAGFAEGLHVRGWMPAMLATRLRLQTENRELMKEFWSELIGSDTMPPPRP